MSNSGYCSLIISGDNLDLDLIEKTLNIEASEKIKKGEVINRVIGESQSDLISFDENVKGKYNPDKTLMSLLDKLADNEEFLKKLNQKACIYIKPELFTPL